MEYRIRSPRPFPCLIAAEQMAPGGLGPYDMRPAWRGAAPTRIAEDEPEDGRLLRIALLPLASWCVGAFLDLPMGQMLGLFLASAAAAGAMAFRR
ncbi:hypothetical protein [Roseococcus pinisoli]|uniref:Uncharacterized protein n=1 Tax=Roseococcus pinisoli TaxID=2835040 RepID=A0ABS5QHL0_9PROT|nr:hypothetical protein [Roseococcus pinisoli]MBS7813196.1 hypothetical protein [Roseococcus pinisoli]